jgi:hypothetical protein
MHLPAHILQGKSIAASVKYHCVSPVPGESPESVWGTDDVLLESCGQWHLCFCTMLVHVIMPVLFRGYRTAVPLLRQTQPSYCTAGHERIPIFLLLGCQSIVLGTPILEHFLMVQMAGASTPGSQNCIPWQYYITCGSNLL